MNTENMKYYLIISRARSAANAASNTEEMVQRRLNKGGVLAGNLVITAPQRGDDEYIFCQPMMIPNSEY